MDAADESEQTIAINQAVAEIRALGYSVPETHPNFDGVHCVECDDELPMLRRSMQKVRCTACQEWLEKGRRLAALNVKVQ